MAKKAKAGNKTKSASSSSSGESNTGLIVTLIFFVIASLTLGVFTYLGYSGQDQFAQDAKKAKAEAAAAKKAQDEETVRRLVLSIATGNEAPGDQQKLAQLKGGAGGVYTATTASLKDKGITWDGAQDRPVATYLDQFAKLTKERDSAVADKRTAEATLKETRDAFDQQKTTLSTQLAKANDDFKKAQNDILEVQKKEHEWYAGQIAKIDTESQQLKQEKEARRDDAAAADRSQRKASEEKLNLAKQIDQLKSRITPPNSIDADTPKGSILRVDRENGLVYINLGSLDFARPNLTFSVMAPSINNKTAASRERKGAIEIASVLEGHLSAARIIDQTNPIREPILAGDLIFNPSWNSGQREHVALAGIFDLDGDGQSDLQEIMRTLERQGIIVDAYVDLPSRTIKGPGITERTTYLVLGEQPELSESAGRSGRPEDDPRVQAMMQINQKIGELRETGTKKGVQIVAYRRYLALVGYPMPKNPRRTDATSAAYLGAAKAETKDAPVPEKKPKAGEEAKPKNGEENKPKAGGEMKPE
ncbi:MAG: hypothetical protein ACJ8C4_11460 [Gemmataceae bacterium]